MANGITVEQGLSVFVKVSIFGIQKAQELNTAWPFQKKVLNPQARYIQNKLTQGSRLLWNLWSGEKVGKCVVSFM